MSELSLSSVPEARSYLYDPDMLDIYQRLSSYDPAAPEAEHLRERQAYATQGFCANGSAMLDGSMPLERMSVIHPTGSGKTVFASELMRIVTSGNSGHNVVMMVPSLRIMSQAMGTADDIGDIRAQNPGVSVGRYSGEQRMTDKQITIMSYQMLNTAIKRGDWQKINPRLVIGDEIHHIIDGSWARDFEQVTNDILTVGLSATPAYTDLRDARTMFPIVLDHMTMRQGIRDGILSDLRGFTYEGESRVRPRSNAEGYTEEDLLQAVIGSKDNYLAAAICAKEVAQGKRGIVSCVPGHDRMHAKVMAKILSQTKVVTPDGERYINAAYIDGDMDPDEIDSILSRYHAKKPEIDVIPFVSLLLEGWNSPATDFGVWLRATPSRVLAEQRIGRLLRRRFGKIATLHEILYQIEDRGPKAQQVTFQDVLRDAAPIRHSVAKPLDSSQRRNRDARRYFNPDDIDIAPEALSQIHAQETEATEDSLITAEKEQVPYRWSTAHLLANKFSMERTEVEAVLRASDTAVHRDKIGERTRTFYSPEANILLAEHCGVELEVPDHHMTSAELIEYCRQSDIAKLVTLEDLANHLEAQGFEPVRCLVDDDVVTAYVDAAHEVLTDVSGAPAPKVRARKMWEKRREARAEVARWLSMILVDPKEAPTKRQRREILIGQNCLLKSIKEGPSPTLPDIDRLSADIERLSIEPSNQMRNVMDATGVNLIHLIVAASHAKVDWQRLTT